MISIRFIEKSTPVDNFLGLDNSAEYVIELDGKDIGFLEAYITTSEIYIFNVILKTEFQKHGHFKEWLKIQHKKIIALWPKAGVEKYWQDIGATLIY